MDSGLRRRPRLQANDSAPTVDQAPQVSLGHGSPDGIVVVLPLTHSDVGLQMVPGTPQGSTDQPGHPGTPQGSTDQPGHQECREEAGTPGSHRTHDPGPQRGGTFVPTLTPTKADWHLADTGERLNER